jgi:hypothetical protein
MNLDTKKDRKKERNTEEGERERNLAGFRSAFNDLCYWRVAV